MAFKCGMPLCAAPALSSFSCGSAILYCVGATSVLAVCVRDTSILLLIPLHANCRFDRECTCCVQDHVLT